MSASKKVLPSIAGIIERLNHEQWMARCDFLPERMLIAAIIARAILDVVADVNIKKTTRFNACRWFVSGEIGEFSFLWCCEAVDLNPSLLLDVLSPYLRVEAVSRRYII